MRFGSECLQSFAYGVIGLGTAFILSLILDAVKRALFRKAGELAEESEKTAH